MNLLVIARCCRVGMGLLLLASSLSTWGATPKRVLILDSFGRDVAPFSIGVSAFRTTLARDLGEPVDIYEAPLDMARFPDPGFEKPLADFLEYRFAGSPVDLVVPIGAPAVRFAAQNRKKLFGETPMLFVGADPRRVPPDALNTNATLVTVRVDLPGVLEDMLQLQPETTNIVAVFGVSPLDKFWAGEFRREWQAFRNRLGFTWLDSLSLQQIQQEVRKLPPRSFIVIPMLVMDAGGVPYDGYEAFEAIHAVANAPVFGCFASQLGRGAIGGRLYEDSKVGILAAEAAIRILRGEKAGDIPPKIIGLSRPTYDWRELTRWGISPERLPPGCEIKFREPTFWEQHRWRIMGVGLFCCLQTLLIVGLLVNRSKRREEETMAALIGQLSSRFINLPADQVDSEIEAAQGRVCEALGLDMSSVWQWQPDNPETAIATHQYRSSGAVPEAETKKGPVFCQWCRCRVLEGEVIKVSSLADLPAEAVRDGEVFGLIGLKSSLIIPLSVGGQPVFGSVDFNDQRRERRWSEGLVQRLQLVAQIFANALARKVADEALRESEARLNLAADGAAMGLWGLNLATNQYWLTARTRELFGFGADEIVTFERFVNVVHPEDRVLVRQKVREVTESKREAQIEYRILLPDGSVRWILSRGRVFGEPARLTGTSIDITERKRAEESIREFSGRFIRAQEQERSRLARELHDDITQRLARLAIDIGQCERVTPAGPIAGPLREVREGLVQLSEDVHALSYRLHPSILEDLGLEDALKAEAERFEQQGVNRIEVKMQEIPKSIPTEAALCLFRVAQEALRNAARHANAQHIALSLRNLDDGLQLAVQDDGCGFDATQKRDRHSLGIAGMRERVHLIGGELDIEAAPGRGTAVLAWVPLKGNKG